ncbi:hypothetical protein [Peribacillus simplex]|uniref:Uncharacterized protein n=1 Tax=Peribacillus simplex TaxID=1478 RepID=A0A9W4L3U3_9BACI|nr:hypothetical protein [Peribacillus simplex]CAH0240117.1 hypothetical protein SRABI133_02861 [Peribacillus simplex]
MSTFSPFKNGIPITVTAAMIEKILRMKSYGQDIKVEITPKHIVLSGTMEVKKMMFKKNVAFRITLKPVHVEKRTIKMNVNAWNIVRKIPVGTIKSYELIEGALKMKLTL